MHEIRPDSPVNISQITLSFSGKCYGLGTVFEPLRRADGCLVAVEMLSRFSAITPCADVLTPAHFYAQASPQQLRKALSAQVSDLQRILPWLQANAVLVSLNVNRALAGLIIQDPWIFAGLAGLQPWLRLEISEHFLQSDAGADDDGMLAALDLLAPLWLDDFGTGSAGLAALLSRRFEVFKLDAGVFAALSDSDDGRELMMSLNRVAQGCGARMIAEGVENAVQWTRVRQTGFWAGQGWLWPGVSAPELTTLKMQDDGAEKTT